MTNYDLFSLSWIEFEDLTRDLLQSEFNIYIESFTQGKDDGIDLRFALTDDKQSIVQCKRMENFNSFYSLLKKEKSKLLDKEIDRYYISTTVNLTPQRKNKIFELFKPIIKSESDIFGRRDIINLISKHRNIEKKYYKLWLTSSTVLQELLNAKVYNSSKIQMKQIEEDARIYVHNESFNEAQNILFENHYIIISGIPGIGKTTLARMLVYHLVASGIHDLIYLSSNIGEAYETYHESNKQVFLFDDFLGSNFLEDKLDRNEDKSLIDFIKKIKESKNKYFIMTTREYILKQAQQKYELLNRHNIEIAKCIIDLAQYTPFVRAEILYRHLYFSKIPNTFLQELLKNQRYLNIIKHKNYNPRIIEVIIDREIWSSISSEKYYDVFYSYFDNPESVWKYAFEQQISHIARIVMIILGSINGLVNLGDIKIAVKKYISYDTVSYIGDFNFDFEKSLRELVGSFIKIEKDDKNIDAIEYHNPSVADFIHSYFQDNLDIVKSIIEKCICLDQLITIYQIFGENVPNEIKILCEKKLLSDFDDTNIIRLERAVSYKTGRPMWHLTNNSIITKLDSISRHMFPLINSNLLIYLEKLFLNEFDNITSDSSYETIVDIYISLYEYIGSDFYKQFIEHIINMCDSIDQLIEITRLKSIDEHAFNDIVNSDSLKSKVKQIADDDYHHVDRGDPEYTRDYLIDVSDYFCVDLNYYVEKLNKQIDENKNKESKVEVNKSYKTDDPSIDYDGKIKELFETLRYK